MSSEPQKEDFDTLSHRFASYLHSVFIYTRYEQIPNISPKYALVSILEQFENSRKNCQKIIGAALKLK